VGHFNSAEHLGGGARQCGVREPHGTSHAAISARGSYFRVVRLPITRRLKQTCSETGQHWLSAGTVDPVLHVTSGGISAGMARHQAGWRGETLVGTLRRSSSVSGGLTSFSARPSGSIKHGSFLASDIAAFPNKQWFSHSPSLILIKKAVSNCCVFRKKKPYRL
jgi:hypothetical protein